MHHALPPRSAVVLVLVVLALLLPQASGASAAGEVAPGLRYEAGEVLIGWDPGQGPVPEGRYEPERLGTDRTDPAWQAAAATLSRATGLAVLSAAPEHGIARLAVPVGSETAEIERLKTLPWIRTAELNYYVYAADAAYPNDPDFPKQWHMHRIKAAEAWSLARGDLTVRVAVLDTGVAHGHPEFAGRLLEGFNYVANVTGSEDDDPESHGTHVTGILKAAMNNGAGVAGLAPDVELLPLKVLRSDRTGRYDAIAAAIYDAADAGAKVINMSLVGLAPSALMENAVTYAQASGSLIVAAAGNCAQDPTNCEGQVNPTVYPAAYPGVIAVAASDRFDRPAIYSGYKPYIGLAAPGGTAQDPIWSTIRGGYGPLYGTSMSTPVVSAAAALIRTVRRNPTPDEVADILRSTAEKVGSDPYSGLPLPYDGGRNDYFGSGRLNAGDAVRRAYPPSLAASTNHVDFLLGGTRTSASRSLELTNPSGQYIYWQASVVSGGPWLTLSPAAGTSLYGYPAPLTLRADRGNLPPDTYYGLVRVQPVIPGGLPPVDMRVELRVPATVKLAYVPLVSVEAEQTWLDPDAPGSLYRNTLSLVNDSMITVALPLAINFYGTNQQLIQVSDNGFVIFGPPAGATGRTPAECPGNALPPNNAIYVLAHDWNPSLGGQIVVHRPDASTYVITWRNVRRSWDSPQQSFQLVMSSAGTFRANYLAVESPLPGTIGAENYDAAFSQQVLCNGAGRQVKSGESVQFGARLPW